MVSRKREQLMHIALLGDYDKHRPSHRATTECIEQAGTYLSKQIIAHWLPTPALEELETLKDLQHFDGIWGAPGDPKSSLAIINAIQVARERDIPYLGT